MPKKPKCPKCAGSRCPGHACTNSKTRRVSSEVTGWKALSKDTSELLKLACGQRDKANERIAELERAGNLLISKLKEEFGNAGQRYYSLNEFQAERFQAVLSRQVDQNTQLNCQLDYTEERETLERAAKICDGLAGVSSSADRKVGDSCTGSPTQTTQTDFFPELHKTRTNLLAADIRWERALNLLGWIDAACGTPDAAQGCRNILARIREFRDSVKNITLQTPTATQVPENYFVLEALDKAAKIAKGYIKETNTCGDECLAKTVCSDICHDIKELRKSYDPVLKTDKTEISPVSSGKSNLRASFGAAKSWRGKYGPFGPQECSLAEEAFTAGAEWALLQSRPATSEGDE